MFLQPSTLVRLVDERRLMCTLVDSDFAYFLFIAYRYIDHEAIPI